MIVRTKGDFMMILRQCLALAFLVGIPLSVIGMLLVMKFVHGEGLLFFIGVALAPASYMAEYMIRFMDVSYWLSVVIIQFLYYFIISCIVRIFQHKHFGEVRQG